MQRTTKPMDKLRATVVRETSFNFAMLYYFSFSLFSYQMFLHKSPLSCSCKKNVSFSVPLRLIKQAYVPAELTAMSCLFIYLRSVFFRL